MKEWTLAVDVGGSGSRAVLNEVSSGTGGTPVPIRGSRISVTPSGIDLHPILESLVPEAKRAVDAGGGGTIVAVAVGMSGLLGLANGREDIDRLLRSHFGPITRVLASDSVTSLVGGLGLRGGAVVAAGTGVVGLGTDFSSRWKRVDGWGHVLGDLGSGSWIGIQALQAALAALDGRPHGSHVLLDRLRHWIGEPEELPRQIYTRSDRAGILATFSKEVAAAAHEGDPASLLIWQLAGIHLANTLSTALRPGLPPIGTYTGGLFDAGELLLEPFRQEFKRLRPDAELRTPEGGSLDGARILALSAVNAVNGGDAFPHHEPYVTLRKG
ncbi:N-acetylglucosamine kinase [Arthrobacter sp. B2a2-09]|uniref:N-acetylglucosamine kinase n=1 Tax=Arthrobacter sp. B2a2-09 TaxID=2952822 RepID=UPI0022CD9A5E|nr:BadF/BadG/BcrA/BcrD ATPase family protein [Arthrobacter sp. B2a2-09]MCZ9883240.1 hypothetical protein [Arthrobacter sp. B2a2-09]